MQCSSCHRVAAYVRKQERKNKSNVGFNHFIPVLTLKAQRSLIFVSDVANQIKTEDATVVMNTYILISGRNTCINTVSEHHGL